MDSDSNVFLREAQLGQLLEVLDSRGASGTQVAGDASGERMVNGSRIQKTGLALAGFLDHVHKDMVQVFGETEIDYLRSLPDANCRESVDRFFGLPPAVVFISANQDVPKVIVEAAERHNVPLIKFELTSGELIGRVERELEVLSAPRTSVHAGLVDVFGMGVLIVGRSGIGKSEVILDLILRGHRFVADDRVDVRCVSEDVLLAAAPETIRNFMEVRGLGIINVRDLYGISAVRDEKRIELVVELVSWEQANELDRMGLDRHTYSLLDIDLPCVPVPVSAGRNLAAIIEVAVRNQLLRVRGIDSASDLVQRIHAAIEKNGNV